MLRNLFFVILIISIISCNDAKHKAQNDPAPTSKEQTIPSSGQFIHDNITFDYFYNQDTDTTQINIQGSEQETYKLKGKIQKYFFSDLNSDTKDEAFVVMKNINGTDHLEAFYISEGYPIQIYIKEVSDAPKNSTKTYSGQYGQLIEKIKVPTPDGKTVSQNIRYNLVAGEAGYTLKPQGWRRDELKDLIGKYSTKKYANNTLYNVIYINESETGEWILDVKVKDAKTNKNICEIQTVGEIINKDLYAPLSYVNADLSATIQVRFVAETAVLYTSNPQNAKQLTTVCNNKGTLMGNYAKE